MTKINSYWQEGVSKVAEFFGFKIDRRDFNNRKNIDLGVILGFVLIGTSLIAVSFVSAFLFLLAGISATVFSFE